MDNDLSLNRILSVMIKKNGVFPKGSKRDSCPSTHLTMGWQYQF